MNFIKFFSFQKSKTVNMLYSRHRHRHRQYVSQTTRTLPPQSERNHEYQKTLGFWAVHSVPR